MHYVKRIKEKNDMFISVDAEKPSIGSNNIHDIKKKKNFLQTRNGRNLL